MINILFCFNKGMKQHCEKQKKKVFYLKMRFYLLFYNDNVKSIKRVTERVKWK